VRKIPEYQDSLYLQVFNELREINENDMIAGICGYLMTRDKL
jgi:hypothetical protein